MEGFNLFEHAMSYLEIQTPSKFRLNYVTVNAAQKFA